ncbi:MAG: DUF2750 domain-containing protein [Clostridia bacterium]|nr:DUF2750 domain-containing protein [Clostridia bacterium]
MLSDKAKEGLVNASPEKRYKSFLTTVADREEVWILSSDEGCTTLDIDGYINIMVWPRKELCFSIEGESPESIEIHDFLDYCEELDDSYRFMVFPTEVDSYIVSVEKMREDLEYYLSQVE